MTGQEHSMFCVLFEVHPRPERFDDYLEHAAMLRPELARVDGFIDNVRYRSRRRDGWLLSLSTWRDEKALVRWRTHAMHHGVQAKGRSEVFQDYRIRVGQVTADTHVPPGEELREQRLEETETGAKLVSIVETKRASSLDEKAPPRLSPSHEGPLDWDVFDALLTPGDELVLVAWRSTAAAEAAERTFPPEARRRRVRVVREYGMFDRREAPQYHPPVPRR
jgi:heme-degrading monooxygenase HmoA